MRPWSVPPAMKHLGGPSAVSWPVFWITLVVAYFALLAGSPDLAAVNPLIRLLTVLAGEAALFAVLGIGQPIWLRCASRLRPWIALLVFAIASAASAVAQGYADVALGLVEGRSDRAATELGYRIKGVATLHYLVHDYLSPFSWLRFLLTSVAHFLIAELSFDF